MILWPLLTQPATAFREFVALRYRPGLHYMRGPGPAYARRAVMVGARSCVVDCHLWPLCRCHNSCVIDDRTKPAPSGVFAGMTLLAVVAADGVLHLCSIADANAGHTICLFVPPRGFLISRIPPIQIACDKGSEGPVACRRRRRAGRQGNAQCLA